MADDDVDGAYSDFKDAVNMTKGELRTWLDSDESKSVGMKAGARRRPAAAAASRRDTK